MKGSNRSRMPSSLYQGQITRLVLQDIWSANPHRLPPTPRLRKLEFSGVMRLGNLFNLLMDSPNLKELFITCPKIVGNESFDGMDLPPKLTHFQLKPSPEFRQCPSELRILKLLSKASLNFLQSFRIVFEGNPFPNNYLILMVEEKIQSLEGSKRAVLATRARYLQEIIQGSNGILKELSLARPYNEPPLNMHNLPLEKLELNWRGDDLWLKDLLEGQGSNKLLKVLSLSCSVQFWMRGIVQDVVGQLKDTLTELHVNLYKSAQEHLREFDLSFFLECSKLRSFSFFSEWHFSPDFEQSINTFPDLNSVVLPPRLEEVTLGGPFRPAAISLFCAHPNLKQLKLVFCWVPNEQNLNLILERPQDAFYLNWQWLQNLVLNCPQLTEVILDRCLLDIKSIEPNLNSPPGVSIKIKSSSNIEAFESTSTTTTINGNITAITITTESITISVNDSPMVFTSAELEISRH